jgi:hypothetical protein
MGKMDISCQSEILIGLKSRDDVAVWGITSPAMDPRDRCWWESKFFQAGFRWPPVFFDVVSYQPPHAANGSPLPEEHDDPILAELPRLIFHFNPRNRGRIRQLIDVVNRE